MRVIIFTETFLPKMDGIVRVICLLLDHLTERGIETMVVAPRLGDEPLERYGETIVVTTEGFRLPWYPELKFAPPLLGAFRQMQEFDPDVAHFFHPVALGLPGMLMAKALGIPTLTSFHVDFARMSHHFYIGPVNLKILTPLTNFLTKTFFNWSDYSLAPSIHIQQKMIQQGIRRVGLWKRGVDSEKFHPRFASDSMRQRLSDGHPEDHILLYVGRLSAEKNLDQIKFVLDRVPNTRLALVGYGPEQSRLEEIFSGTNTVFMGYLEGEELASAYASADIFVFPSALESFGLVAVEAMAAGLPVVASRVGGIPDIVEEGVTGYSFEVDDIAGLVAGVEQITGQPGKREAMGRAARAFAETQSWGHMMDEVIDVYAGLRKQ